MTLKPLTWLLLAATSALAGSAWAEQRLYVLNSLSDDMTVIDVATNTVIGSITVGPRPHGVAAPASQDVLYVSTEEDGGLTVVDLVAGKVKGKYPVLGARPNEIDITSDGRFVYVPISGEGVYKVFDTQKEAIVARIPTDGGPHNAVVSPDDRYMYLSPLRTGPEGATENRKVYIADVSTHSVVDTISLDNAPRPTAISPDGKRLFINTDNLLGFVVVDIASRRVVAEAKYEMTDDERATPSRSHGIGVTPDGREVWSTDINNGVVHVFDVTGVQPRHIARMQTGNQPLWIAVSRDGRTVYIANKADDTISAFDVASKREVARIELEKGKGPQRMLVVDVPVPGSS